jgi:hypothetical protein
VNGPRRRTTAAGRPRDPRPAQIAGRTLRLASLSPRGSVTAGAARASRAGGPGQRRTGNAAAMTLAASYPGVWRPVWAIGRAHLGIAMGGSRAGGHAAVAPRSPGRYADAGPRPGATVGPKPGSRTPKMTLGASSRREMGAGGRAGRAPGARPGCGRGRESAIRIVASRGRLPQNLAGRAGRAQRAGAAR